MAGSAEPEEEAPMPEQSVERDPRDPIPPNSVLPLHRAVLAPEVSVDIQSLGGLPNRRPGHPSRAPPENPWLSADGSTEFGGYPPLQESLQQTRCQRRLGQARHRS